jgi:hypothetical protein
MKVNEKLYPVLQLVPPQMVILCPEDPEARLQDS